MSCPNHGITILTTILTLAISANAAAEPLSWESLDIETSRCKELGTVTLNPDGSAQISYRGIELEGRGDTLCHAVGRVSIPKGFALASGLTATFSATAMLENTGDKATIMLKVQSGTLVESMRKTIAFSTEGGQETPLEFSGHAKLPVVGNCEQDLAIGMHFAAIIRATSETAASRLRMEMNSIHVTPLSLTKLECPEPPSERNADELSKIRAL